MIKLLRLRYDPLSFAPSYRGVWLSKAPVAARGTVYLLHFSAPYHHARHYLGWTSDLEERIADHQSGRGARLIEVITNAGLTFDLSRTWEDCTRTFERRLKAHGKARLCPLCTDTPYNPRSTAASA